LFVEEFGVFARKTIQKHTQFGPLEGVNIKDEECVEESMNDEFKYLLEVDKQFRRIDVSNEGKCFNGLNNYFVITYYLVCICIQYIDK